MSQGVLAIGIHRFGSRLGGAILQHAKFLQLPDFIAAKRSYLPIALRPYVVLDGFAGALEEFLAIGAVDGFHDR